MVNKVSNSRRIAILILLILAGELIFFLPFVFARVFRPTLLEVFQISNLELGTYFSIYGLVAMVSYILGGPLADKFSSRNLISLALVATSLGGIALALEPSKALLTWVYAWWGFTTIFLFWAALIKSTRLWGGDAYQGKAFGFLEGGRGGTAALVASLALIAFADLSSEISLELNSELRIASYRKVMLISSALIIVCAILIRFVMPADKNTGLRNAEKISLSKLFQLAKMPELWLLSGIIICAYAGYKITDIFSLYAKEIMGFNEFEAARFGTIILWMRPLFAILAGIAADRFSPSKTLILLFIILLAGSIFMLFEPSSGSLIIPIISLIISV
ncbi:MAG: MFS transporter, partial [Bacteroidia bacterium]